MVGRAKKVSRGGMSEERMVKAGGRQLLGPKLGLCVAMKRRRVCFFLINRVGNCGSVDEDADQSCKLCSTSGFRDVDKASFTGAARGGLYSTESEAPANGKAIIPYGLACTYIQNVGSYNDTVNQIQYLFILPRDLYHCDWPIYKMWFGTF